MEQRSKFSPLLFIVTILCFLLPFITVSCNGQKVASFSGVELAFGTTVQQPQMFGPAQKKNVDAEPLATVAGLCAVVGLALSFAGLRTVVAQGVSGGLGALFLLLLQASMESDITKQGGGVFRLEYEAGYVLALLFFVAAAAWNFYLFFQGRKAPAAATSPSQAAAAAAAAGAARGSPAASAVACPNCGQPLKPGGRFCASCGKPAN